MQGTIDAIARDRMQEMISLYSLSQLIARLVFEFYSRQSVATIKNLAPA